jgi:peptide/nickel transport system ATP-binding protein
MLVPSRTALSSSVLEDNCLRSPGSEAADAMSAGSTASTSILSVKRLEVCYTIGPHVSKTALEDVSLSIHAGEVVAVVGESGSGKSSLALAVARLLPSPAKSRGSISFEGRELTSASETQLQQIRGARISLIYQEPGLSLHPMMRAGDQVANVYRAHAKVSQAQARRATQAIFERLFPQNVSRIFASYPHELSGGQQQRVVIAQAIICHPALVIADEPTASLDMETQLQILQLLLELKREFNLALLLITHNIAMLQGIADRVLVMYSGRVVEQGTLEQVFGSPLHPYTQSLLSLARGNPSINDSWGQDLASGNRGDEHVPRGCRFAPRCPDRFEKCVEHEPDENFLDSGRSVRCFLHAS